MGRSKATLSGGLAKWWGVLAAAILVGAWINRTLGPTIIITLSLAITAWTLFQAPVTCGAPVRTRGGSVEGCRNNAHGLLLGCWIRQHRFQKLKMLILRRQVREFCTGLFTDAKSTLVTLVAISTIISALVALVPGAAIK